jgi:signal recognition particle subunit SRP68
MVERLDEFDDDISLSNPNLIDVDPKIEPIAFKPIYYDIAGNYVDYPLSRLEARLGITESMDIEGEDASPREDKKGLMGLVSSLFGGGR